MLWALIDNRQLFASEGAYPERYKSIKVFFFFFFCSLAHSNTPWLKPLTQVRYLLYSSMIYCIIRLLVLLFVRANNPSMCKIPTRKLKIINWWNLSEQDPTLWQQVATHGVASDMLRWNEIYLIKRAWYYLLFHPPTLITMHSYFFFSVLVLPLSN